jgi:ubiquinone biosynthesis protein
VSLLRAIAIVGQLARSGLIILLRLLPAARKGQAQRRAIIGEEIAALLQRLGPIFLKVGQIASTRMDFFPPEILASLGRLQDSAAPVTFTRITQCRVADFGFLPRQAFAEVEDEPVASGSIACVYRGTTHDGRRVAVKVRRAEVARLLASDLSCIRAAARAASHLRVLRHVPLIAATETICRAIADQTDFVRELDFMQRTRTSLAVERFVAVPQVLPELCGPAIITMEFFEAFLRRGGEHAGGQPYAEAARNGLGALYRMIFVDGLIHCDLHGGNIRLLPHGRVMLVDFGLAEEMSVADRLTFAEFFYSVAAGNGDNCAAILVQTAASLPGDLRLDAFRADIQHLVESVGRTPRTFSVAGFATRLFQIQRRHGIVGSTAFFSAIMALFVYEGTVRRWLPHLDFLREAERYIFLGSFVGEPPRRSAA